MPIDKSKFFSSGLVTKPVEVPGLGKVFVRKISAAARDHYMETYKGAADSGKLAARLIQDCVVDESGVAIFDDTPETEEHIYRDVDVEVLDILSDAIMTHNGMKDLDKTIVAAAKN